MRSLSKIVISSAFVALLASAAFHATPAHAQSVPSTWKNTATLKCIDSNAVGNVYTLSCNGGAFQLWSNVSSNFGNQIINSQTGRCLDSSISGRVYTLPCNGGAFQQWVVTNAGQFGWQIQNVATGFCLDSNAHGNVYTLRCNGGNFQRWF